MSRRASLTRREFLVTAGAAAAVSVAAGCNLSTTLPAANTDSARLTARPGPLPPSSDPPPIGTTPLGLASGRDGFIYLPASYTPARPAPLVILLHGAGRSSTEWSSAPLEQLFGTKGIVVVGPDSRGSTWDLATGGYGPDVAFIDRALALAFRRCNIDPARLALGGFSDGASYALSLGVTNGDLFPALMAFSPGYYLPAAMRGKPRIFVSHGTHDSVLQIDRSSRVIVPRLIAQGYDVRYTEFDGDHTVTLAIAQSAVDWFMA